MKTVKIKKCKSGDVVLMGNGTVIAVKEICKYGGDVSYIMDAFERLHIFFEDPKCVKIN